MAKRFSGKRMRELRTARYPRIEQWAVALDRGWRAVTSYELDHHAPPVQVIERAAEVLDVDPGEFFVAARRVDRKHPGPRGRLRTQRAECAVSGCNRASHARGHCRLHYDRLRRADEAVQR